MGIITSKHRVSRESMIQKIGVTETLIAHGFGRLSAATIATTIATVIKDAPVMAIFADMDSLEIARYAYEDEL